MKVLLCHPQLNEPHPMLQNMKERGFTVLACESLAEAKFLLEIHGKSIEVIVLHSEGPSAEDAKAFVEQMRRETENPGLAWILSSERDCQSSANSKIRWPFDADELTRAIQTALGKPSLPPPAEAPGFVLEDATMIFNSASPPPSKETSIRLEVESIEVPSDHIDIGMALPFATEESPSELLPPVPSFTAPEPVESPPALEKPRPEPSVQPLFFAEPVGDAVVPGGAAEAPDTQTLKRYLLLRERDVAVLSTQLKSSKDQVDGLQIQLEKEKGLNAELNEHLERLNGSEEEQPGFVRPWGSSGESLKAG